MSGRGWMEMVTQLLALLAMVVLLLWLWLPEPPSSPRMGCATETDLTLRAALHCDEGRP